MSSQTTEGYNTLEEDEKLKEYSWDDIKKHNQEEKLWVVIHNRVYDLTKFQLNHPGGPEVLHDISTQDATEQFEKILHTEKARKLAKTYLIGKVKDTIPGDLFATKEKDETEPASMNIWVTIGFLAVAVGIAYFCPEVLRVLLCDTNVDGHNFLGEGAKRA
eukprot:UN02711